MLSCKLKKSKAYGSGSESSQWLVCFWNICISSFMMGNFFLRILYKKLGPDVVCGSNGFFPTWVKHFNTNLNRITWARFPAAGLHYLFVCDKLVSRTVGSWKPGNASGFLCPASHTYQGLSTWSCLVSICETEVKNASHVRVWLVHLLNS